MNQNPILERNRLLKSLREAELTENALKSLLASSPAVWAETLTELEGQKLQLEPFQINFLNDRSTFRIVNKSRQLGFSTIISIETTHAAATRQNYNANIVSTTQDEAAEKLKAGDMLYSSIDPEWAAYGFKPVKWKNAAEELAFHAPPNTSSIVSKPGTSAVRGGKKDMYYDEAAHIREFAKLWQAGLPAITRGAGRVTVVSTPLGQSGLYYELWNTDRWSHHQVPWWHSRFMVKGGTYDDVAEAIFKIEKESMDTEERVEVFGSEKIKEIFEIGMQRDVIQFKTEYECEFVDEADAFFPYDILLENKKLGKPWKTWHDGYEPAGHLTIGVDLATQRDATVITVAEHLGEQKKLVFHQELHDKYEQQFDILKKLVASVKPTRISIDATGPGQMFAQKASAGQLETGAAIEAVNFNNEKKEKWATTFKGDLQTSKVAYSDHPKFISQTHSIKRTRTETGRFKFAGEKHDDYFWSAMLALYGEGRVPIRFSRI